jgi:hypothetical protein
LVTAQGTDRFTLRNPRSLPGPLPRAGEGETSGSEQSVCLNEVDGLLELCGV